MLHFSIELAQENGENTTFAMALEMLQSRDLPDLPPVTGCRI